MFVGHYSVAVLVLIQTANTFVRQPASSDRALAVTAIIFYTVFTPFSRSSRSRWSWYRDGLTGVPFGNKSGFQIKDSRFQNNDE
jgi:hypothetical protein